jgi:hypothetical protein
MFVPLLQLATRCLHMLDLSKNMTKQRYMSVWVSLIPRLSWAC